MVKFKSTHESNYDIYFKLWQFGWSLCRDLKILEWWTWVTFLFLEEFVSLELFIFHQTTRFPKEMEELSKKALLWQLQDFIMTSSCLKGIFLVSVITKKYPNFLMLPFEKQNHRNLFLCNKETRFQLSLGQSSMFLNGNNLQVSCWAASVGFTVVIATIRFELTIGFNPWFFLKENHHRWWIPSSFPFRVIWGKLNKFPRRNLDISLNKMEYF